MTQGAGARGNRRHIHGHAMMNLANVALPNLAVIERFHVAISDVRSMRVRITSL